MPLVGLKALSVAFFIVQCPTSIRGVGVGEIKEFPQNARNQCRGSAAHEFTGVALIVVSSYSGSFSSPLNLVRRGYSYTHSRILMVTCRALACTRLEPFNALSLLLGMSKCLTSPHGLPSTLFAHIRAPFKQKFTTRSSFSNDK